MKGTRIDAMHRSLMVLTAANSEARRAGHSQVDVDHLLLALLVVDGDSARALIHAGMALGSARTALAEQDRDDLRAIGIYDVLPAHDWTPPVPAQCVSDFLPFTEAARAMVKDYRRWAASDLDLLRQLLANPQGPSARLFRRLGIDLAKLETRPLPAEPRAWSRGEMTRVELTVPVSADALWRTIADPTRRPDWDEDAGAVEIHDEDNFTITPRFVADATAQDRAGPLAGLEVGCRVLDQTPGRFVEWEISYPRREDQKPYCERQSIEVVPTDGGARLILTVSTPSSRLRLVRRLVGWTDRYQLRTRAQALAQVS